MYSQKKFYNRFTLIFFNSQLLKTTAAECAGKKNVYQGSKSAYFVCYPDDKSSKK